VLDCRISTCHPKERVGASFQSVAGLISQASKVSPQETPLRILDQTCSKPAWTFLRRCKEIPGQKNRHDKHKAGRKHCHFHNACISRRDYFYWTFQEKLERCFFLFSHRLAVQQSIDFSYCKALRGETRKVFHHLLMRLPKDRSGKSFGFPFKILREGWVLRLEGHAGKQKTRLFSEPGG
jgi:hypothetical protein